MGIYIPGIDMPDSCDNCFICNRCEGNCDISDADYLPNKRPDDCPLVELPPHGRLIDADALEFLYEESADGWRHTPVFMDFFKACAKGVREMPTIIPAEGGEPT